MSKIFVTGLAGVLSLTLACGGSSDTPVEKPVQPADTGAPAVTVKPIPDGLRAITPVLVVGDIDSALAFYAEALSATTRLVLPGPDGKTMHAEMKIGDSVVMLSAEDPARGAKAPATLGGSNGSLLVYVEDVDAAFKTVVDAGAKPMMPPGDMFWGDRYAAVIDPSGHMWGIATHKEDVSDEEMGKRAQAWMAAAQKGQQYSPPAVEKPAASWKPEGYGTVTVTLLLSGNADGLEFYAKALGAEISDKMLMPDGKLMHASVKIGDSLLHLSSEFPQMNPNHKAATNLGGSPVGVYYYVADVDAGIKAAVAGGATSIAPATDMFWGDRWGLIKDPSGNDWGVATHKEDVSKEQMQERMKKQLGGADK